MKTRILVVAIVLAALATLGWYYLNQPAAEPAVKTADAPTPATVATPKPAAVAVPVAPPRAAQVAAPVVAAAKPGPTPAVAAPAAETFVAEPQSDLKTCVATMAHFLETQDILSLVKTIMPPDAINQMIQSGQANSVEDIAEHYRQMPDVADKMNQLLWSLQDVQAQNQEPELSADGASATYKIDQRITGPGQPPAPAGTPGTLTFVKVNGFWYLR